MESNMEVPLKKTLKTELSYDPAIPLLGIQLEKTIIQKDPSRLVFMAGILTHCFLLPSSVTKSSDFSFIKSLNPVLQVHTHTHTHAHTQFTSFPQSPPVLMVLYSLSPSQNTPIIPSLLALKTIPFCQTLSPLPEVQIFP